MFSFLQASLFPFILDEKSSGPQLLREEVDFQLRKVLYVGDINWLQLEF
jgi:hypothetical protein